MLSDDPRLALYDLIPNESLKSLDSDEVALRGLCDLPRPLPLLRKAQRINPLLDVIHVKGGSGHS